MDIIILDTDTELNKFYRNTFKNKYPESNLHFVYTANDLFNLLENELKITLRTTEKSANSSNSQSISANENDNAPIQNSNVHDENVISDFQELTNTKQEETVDETTITSELQSANKSKIILITESIIPDMDSFDYLEKVKLYNIPTVVISSEYSERMIIECMRHGASDFLSKRNIKHGHFIDIIERALFTDDKNKLINNEYKKLNQLVLSSLKNEKSEKIRNRLSRGMIIEDDEELIEGEHYNIIYLYVQIKPSKESKTSIDANRLKVLYDKFLNRFSEISLKYGRKFGLRKMDGCFFGFANDSYFQALVAAMEILAQMNVYNITTENLNGQIFSDIAIASGDTTYKDKIGDITSQSLNLCAHMAIKAKINHGILITKDIYDNIDPRAEKYFKKAGEFEGSQVYVYRNKHE